MSPTRLPLADGWGRERILVMDMPDELAERIAFRFKALSDPARIRILACLHDEERQAGAIAEATGLSQPSTSKHLSWLKRAGILSSRREGTAIFYAIRDPSILSICDIVCGSLRDEHRANAIALGLHRRKKG